MPRLISLYSTVRTVAAVALTGALVVSAVPNPTRAAGNSMQLQHVRGTIGYQVTTDGADFKPVFGKFDLPADDFAVTRAQSAGVIAMPDSSLVSLGENTNVKVAAFENAAAGPGSTITVNGGALRFDIKRPQGGVANYRFVTTTSAVGVRGTVGLLSFVNGITTVGCLACTHMLGRIDPVSSVISHYASGLGTGPTGITMGGDGNIWFSGGPTIGRITLAGGVPTIGPATINIGGVVQQLGCDSQGNVWFVNSSLSDIGYVDLSFTPHPYPAANNSLTQISGLAEGADNAMYFTESGGSARNVARVTTPANGVPGTVTETPVANSGPTIFPWDIAAGPDGNLWFGEFASNGAMQFFGKFPPVANPTITEYANTFDPNAFANLVTMAKGLDGNMWIAEGGGAVSIPPTNPTMPNVQFFTDVGQTTMVKCIGGPDSSGQSNPGQIWCTAIGGPPLSAGFIATTDSIVTWKPR